MIQIYGKADRNHYEAKSIRAEKFPFHKISNEKSNSAFINALNLQ